MPAPLPSRWLAATLLPTPLFVVCADWHRLQWRLDQPQCDPEVVKPVLQFLFHSAPLRVVPSGRVLEPLSSDNSAKFRALLNLDGNDLLPD
ncbi:hypothetical protein C4K14_1584 [Pseudomonas chlororaphis subsp. aureofaciens]|nr:hypothetical protein C4K14_1584 [Pseudomonas chlororaphis subsp. aureofaciens]